MKITRDFEPADRYRYDFGLCSIRNGFAQVDTKQDAHYFGTWANPFKLAILNYCEGDVTLSEAASEYEFVAELRRIELWNRDQGHERFNSNGCWIGIDPGFNEGLKAAFVKLGVPDLLH